MWPTLRAPKQNIMSRCTQDLAMSWCALKLQRVVPEPYTTYPAICSGDHTGQPPPHSTIKSTLPFNHSERSTALSKHPFQVTSNTLGLLNRGKMPTTILLALEDNLPQRASPSPGQNVDIPRELSQAQQNMRDV